MTTARLLRCLLCAGSLAVSRARAQPSEAPPASATPVVVFTAEETLALHHALDRQWQDLQPAPKSDLVFRTLFTMLLNAVGTGWHPERWSRLLDLAGQLHQADPQRDRYGNFRWFWSDPGVNDPNAVEFAMQRAALVWELYANRLSPEDRKRLAALTDLSIEGIHRHRVPVSYTNVFLVRTWDLIALGEALDRPALADEGYQMLEEWVRYTDRFGIHEYLSPTYVGGHMNPLGNIVRFARRAAGRANAEAGLRLLWADVSVNWFAPGGRLGGAHSRDYYYLTGEGVVSKHLRGIGWLPARPEGEHDQTADNGGVYWRASLWSPPTSVVPPEKQPVPRAIYERWGELPSQFASNYVGRHFSLGAAGECYSYQDKSLTMIWESEPKTPMLYFIMEGRGDPYGKKTLNAGGHQKTVNMIPAVTSVQRGSEVLYLAWLDLSRAVIKHGKEDVNQLASHLVMPVMDRYWLGDRSLVSLPADARETLPSGAAFVVRRGDVSLGVRVLAALRTDGSPATVELNGDGRAYGACRLTVTHDDHLPQGRALVAFWLRAAEGLDDAGMERFRREFATAPNSLKWDRDRLTVTAEGNSGPLRLAVNLATDERLLREGGEPAPADSLLWVNGRELGRELMQNAPALSSRP